MRLSIVVSFLLWISNSLSASALLSWTKSKQCSTFQNTRSIYNFQRRSTRLFLATETDDKNVVENDWGDHEKGSIWSPRIRKVMGGLAAFGVLETSYLTFKALTGGLSTELLFCSASSDAGGLSCGSVISGPYSHIPGTEIPLSAVGLVAYSVTFVLALLPLFTHSLSKKENLNEMQDDAQNRVLLLTLTTTMTTFSIFLISILFNVLHQSCLYCIASAICSIGLGSLAWLGGGLPVSMRKAGVSMSFGGGALSMLLAVALIGLNDPNMNIDGAQESIISSSSLLAKSNDKTTEQAILPNGQLPPEVTTESTETALRLAADLQKLDATFYGAYWCSHCYDQKQALGKQAMQRIPYVECSKEGLNAQVALCKEKNIPGYPTWEISGKLFPGEKALDEIQEIVVSLKNGVKN